MPTRKTKSFKGPVVKVASNERTKVHIAQVVIPYLGGAVVWLGFRGDYSDRNPTYRTCLKLFMKEKMEKDAVSKSLQKMD